MNKKTIVTANETGQVINVSANNPDYGYIRVEQTQSSFDTSGWVRLRTVSALIPGAVDDLKSLGWAPGMQLSGNIVTTESLEPFNPENPEKDYKIAGETEIVCCLDGQPIYRRSFYTEDPNRTNTLIEHNNTDAIKAAYAALQTETAEEGADLES